MALVECVSGGEAGGVAPERGSGHYTPKRGSFCVSGRLTADQSLPARGIYAFGAVVAAEGGEDGF